jgi:hypothetical protein
MEARFEVLLLTKIRLINIDIYGENASFSRKLYEKQSWTVQEALP